ncbi:hypothetical protein [Defluviimonas sp. WL0075]|uniref:Lipoprotein n=1 Tax=Albidovulum sediminicola TaxID=2984331 RepID=A0ABT2Z1G1_9RHOB|nr:hypothetical protein [Defluviimonas sp. WL0075]MCV2864990.1 hypothetical protein [Defluviimonas sp. WL0075]
MRTLFAALPQIHRSASFGRAGLVLGLLALSACAVKPTLPEGEQVSRLMAQGFTLAQDGRGVPGPSVLTVTAGDADAVLICTDAKGSAVPAGARDLTTTADGLTVRARQVAQVDARVLVDDEGALSGDYYYTVRRSLTQGRTPLAEEVENHHFGPADTVRTKARLLCRPRD